MATSSNARKLNTDPGKLQAFFDLHYPANEPYTGNVHLWARNKKTDSFYRVRYGTPAAVLAKIQNDKADRMRQDYYLTANTMQGGTRELNALFAYNNIVVDLDNHKTKCTLESMQKQFKALQLIYTDNYADLTDTITPNTIIYTGRGFQLWYALEQVGYKCADVWQTITDEIINQVEQTLKDHADILQGLSIDTGASRNAAGLFRMPGSWNSKAGTHADIYQVHDEPIQALDVAHEIRHRKAPATIRKFKPAENTQGAYNMAQFRHNALTDLVKIRQDKGQTVERDNFIFCIACIWGKVCQDDTAIIDKARACNELFNDPMPDKEIKGNLYTALKKRYTMRNKTIIERLAISEEEQKQIRLFASTTNRTEERAEKRTNKASKYAQVLADYQNGETSQQELADKYEISRRTVNNILQSANARKCDVKASKQAEIIRIEEERTKALKRAYMSEYRANNGTQDAKKTGKTEMCKNCTIYGGNTPGFQGVENTQGMGACVIYDFMGVLPGDKTAQELPGLEDQSDNAPTDPGGI